MVCTRLRSIALTTDTTDNFRKILHRDWQCRNWCKPHYLRRWTNCLEVKTVFSESCSQTWTSKIKDRFEEISRTWPIFVQLCCPWAGDSDLFLFFADPAELGDSPGTPTIQGTDEVMYTIHVYGQLYVWSQFMQFSYMCVGYYLLFFRAFSIIFSRLFILVGCRIMFHTCSFSSQLFQETAAQFHDWLPKLLYHLVTQPWLNAQPFDAGHVSSILVLGRWIMIWFVLYYPIYVLGFFKGCQVNKTGRKESN